MHWSAFRLLSLLFTWLHRKSITFFQWTGTFFCGSSWRVLLGKFLCFFFFCMELVKISVEYSQLFSVYLDGKLSSKIWPSFHSWNTCLLFFFLSFLMCGLLELLSSHCQCVKYSQQLLAATTKFWTDGFFSSLFTSLLACCYVIGATESRLSSNLPVRYCWCWTLWRNGKKSALAKKFPHSVFRILECLKAYRFNQWRSEISYNFWWS